MSLTYLNESNEAGSFRAVFGRPRNRATILRAKEASNKSSSHNRLAMRHTHSFAASSIKRFESVKLRRKRCLVKVNGIFTSSVDLMRTPVSSSRLDQFLADTLWLLVYLTFN